MNSSVRFTFLVLALLLSACTYTYIPPVPEAQAREALFDLRSEEGLVQEGERLRLEATLGDVPEADWLAVQWFAPNNDQVASASVWLEPSDAGGTLALRSPERVTLRTGTWRAVLSFQSRIVRQFAVEVN